MARRPLSNRGDVMLFSAFLPMDIFSADYAEAIYCFICQPHILEDFRSKENLSFAEYVQIYKLEEFTAWYNDFVERGEV